MNKKGYLNKLMLACLALLMSFSVSLEAYAVDITAEEAKKQCEINSGVVLSDYFLTYSSTAGSSSLKLFTYFSADYEGTLFMYKVDDCYYLGTYKNDNTFIDDYRLYCVGVSFNLKTYECVGGSSGSYSPLSLKYIDSFDMTNLPLFSDLNSAKAYYLEGDASGLLNTGDLLKSYSKDVETPKDLRVDMDADFRAQMGYAPGNGDEDVDASNSYCKFTWSQSDEVVEAGDYVTEIYYQTSFVHHSNPLCIGSKTFSLSSSKLIAAVPVDKVNMSYTMDFSRIEEIYQEWLDAGLIGGTMKPTYPTEPYYFYVRNVCGNAYGNWVRVTVNNDNVSVSNSITGANTVTGGYTEIDGSTATLPDVNQKLDGDVVNDSQYGINYRVDIDKESYNDIITFIKNGFGLLGEDGLIAFFKSVFSFLPEPVWAMIFCMVGTCVVFIVVKVAIG